MGLEKLIEFVGGLMGELSLFFSLRFIILGCDGLFKVFSAEDAVKYILNVLQVYIMLTMCVYG